ncbi:MAG: TonB-dependent receptor [Candidatus Binatia bacterium]|nr:TonB-dependent receptor [Candidatus Binatia bacterium]
MRVFPRLLPMLIVLAVPLAAVAQTPQSEAVEDWETQSATGGAETEMDAAEAQAQAVESGEPTGLSRRASNQVEEIVVSARRRDELLEDTPVSVTALGEAALRESNITQMTNLNGIVPNLQFQAGGGNPNLAQVFIRGVGQVDADQLTSDPGVGVYVDGVYLARAQGTVLDVVDVAQLEVLRGPQGTLFGKNTAGGALNITSVKPTEEFEGFVLLRPGNLGQIDTRVTLNIPIWEDRVYSRMTFASFMNGGYMFNSYEDEYWSDRNTLAFQGSLRILPHDDVTIDITGSYSKAHSTQFGAHCTMFDESALQTLVPGFREACKKSSTLTTRNFKAEWPGMADLQSWGIWGTIQWDIGDASVFEDLSFKSITAYRAQEEAFRRDMDMTEFNLGSQTSTGEDVVFGDFTLPSTPLFASQVSQEFQMNGTAWDGKINYVGGVYYLADSADNTRATGFVPNMPSVGGVFYAESHLDNSSIAVFGQATADILDWMSLTGGIRWTQEDKQASLLDVEPAVRVRADGTESKKFQAWTPMGTLAMRLPEEHLPDQLDHFMGYFTFAKGFKSGGFNLRPIPEDIELLEPYEPENLNSYEIGFKTIGWDRKLTFNTSLFLSDYDNIQVLTVTTVDTGGFIPTVVPLTQNAATATVKGVEMELLLMPFEGMRIQANGALLDTEYGEYAGVSDLTGLDINRKGETFSNVPPYTAFLAAQYSFELDVPSADWVRGWLTPRVEGVLSGPIHYQGPELPTATQGAFGLLNARLAYDFNDDRSQVALWGRNLTDTIYFNSSIPITAFGFNLPFLGAPRTFGAELTHRF